MREFGTTQTGEVVHAITITSGQLSVTVLTRGAVLHDVRLGGAEHPLTLGSPDIGAYEGPLTSFGSIVGPVANRIKNATAMIAGQSYNFEANLKKTHTLHSGAAGVQHKVWTIEDTTPDSVTLALTLPDGEGGLPGNRTVRAKYQVDGLALMLEITAISDAATLFSFANHSYWNLDGGAGYAGHQLQVFADTYLEANDALMPTGQRIPVAGSAIDTSTPLTLAGSDAQFFDHNYCVSEAHCPLRKVAILTGTSGLKMTMSSTEPGLQVYDCSTISGHPFASHHGAPYETYAGVALEAQLWPGATTHAHFPSVEFAAGAVYSQTTQWAFSKP